MHCDTCPARPRSVRTGFVAARLLRKGGIGIHLDGSSNSALWWLLWWLLKTAVPGAPHLHSTNHRDPLLKIHPHMSVWQVVRTLATLGPKRSTQHRFQRLG